MTRLRFTDAQIFFVALLGFCIALLTAELLPWLGAGTPSDAPDSLIARVAPRSATSPIYLFFVLLPVALAVFAIGIPYLLRTLVGAVRGRLSRRELRGLLSLLAAGAAAIAYQASTGASIAVAVLVAMAVITFAHSWDALGPAAGALGTRLLGAAGLCLGAVAYHELELLGGADPGVAIAPTFVVLTVALGVAALPLMSAAALARTRAPGWPTVIVAWLTAAAWCAAPSLRERSSGRWPPDQLELSVTIAAACLIGLLWLVAELRRRRALRPLPARTLDAGF